MDYITYQPSFDHRQPAPPGAVCRVESASFSRPLHLDCPEDRLALEHARAHVGRPCPIHRKEHQIHAPKWADTLKAMAPTLVEDNLRRLIEESKVEVKELELLTLEELFDYPDDPDACSV